MSYQLTSCHAFKSWFGGIIEYGNIAEGVGDNYRAGGPQREAGRHDLVVQSQADDFIMTEGN